MAKQRTVTSEQAKAAKTGIPTVTADERRCLCGCQQPVAPKRMYRAGHDMVVKSRLLRQFDAGDTEAGADLVARGWKTQEQLDTRKAKAEARAAKAAEREAARAVRGAAKANAKAAKAADTEAGDA